jgi:signal peptidase I
MSVPRLLFLIALALAIGLPARQYAIEPIYIPTASMEPTLLVGVHLFCDKITLKMRDPHFGDIIVFQSPAGQNEDLVKRVIAMPGQTVEIRDKAVFIDGKPLEETYVIHKRADERLLGDNRDESNDSSRWKDARGERIFFLPRSNIIGLVRGFY